jgi:hypothetical protein
MKIDDTDPDDSKEIRLKLERWLAGDLFNMDDELPDDFLDEYLDSDDSVANYFDKYDTSDQFPDEDEDD